MIAYQLTHNRHHQHRSCQIIHIGRNHESDERERPKESLTTTHAQPLDEGIEYTIMEHHLQDGICSNQEENDRTSLNDIMSHQVLRHKTAHSQTPYLVRSLISGILLRMHQLQEISRFKNIENPDNDSAEHGYCCSVDVVDSNCTHQQIACEQHRNYYKSHHYHLEGKLR